jgi:Icc-related predicted phosphoesterase
MRGFAVAPDPSVGRDMLLPQILTVALICLLCALSGCCTAAGTAYRSDFPVHSKCITIVGDTQRTLAVERVIGREQNDAERSRIVAAIVQEKPDLLVHLGDVVAMGAVADEWRRFDELFAPIRAAEIPVLPVIGNHDYWVIRSVAMTNLRSRFPAAGEHWYARRYANLMLIWLDSNRACLSREEWEEQERWLKGHLHAADQDSSIQATLVFCHHPPFTNSTVTTDDPDVKSAFLPAFIHSTKTLAMICGHTHGYERFESEGKTFLVSGGGGGPRPKLLTGDKQRHPDLFAGPSPRPFHYLLIRPAEKGIQIEVKGFQKGQDEVRTIDRFTLAYRD